MDTVETDEVGLLSAFGIRVVRTSVYHYREWRYSNLDDAVAQAKRDVALENKIK